MNENWNIVKVLQWTTEFFKEKELEAPRLDAELIVSEVLKIPRLALYLQFDRPLTDVERTKIRSFVVRRAKREPIQYIFGYTEFYGHKFIVNENVLIPRPETEILCERILKEVPKNAKVLDIGTGSGTIALTLKKERPDLDVFASDICPKALNVAKENSKNLAVEISFFLSDLLQNITEKDFDYIIANPPYIPENEYMKLSPELLMYEPKKALTAENDGLICYDEILKHSPNYLKLNGVIFFEIGYNQGNKIEELAQKYNYSETNIIKDYNNFDRIARIQ